MHLELSATVPKIRSEIRSKPISPCALWQWAGDAIAHYLPTPYLVECRAVPRQYIGNSAMQVLSVHDFVRQFTDALDGKISRCARTPPTHNSPMHATTSSMR